MSSHAIRCSIPVLVSLMLAACGGGGDATGASTPTSPGSGAAPPPPPPAPTVNVAPTIGGKAPTEVTAGRAYAFAPTATDPDGDALTFAIANKPAWAEFDAKTGGLAGTPSAADVGTYANVTITVSDGKANAALAAFTIAVNSVSVGATTVSWEAPTTHEDGTPLTTLAGYRVLYGQSAGALTQSVKLDNPSLTRHTVDNLSAGAWHFAVVAYTATGTESALSGVVSTTIPN